MPRDPLDWIPGQLDALDAQGLRRSLATRFGPQSAVIRIDGRETANFGSNDYLGLAGAALNAAVKAAIDQCGWGSGASPLVTGREAWHARLESEIAEFEATEAALLFSSGYAANCGAIAALADRGDAVFSDERNHASMIDGCRLSRAEVRVYRHADADHLSDLLSNASSARRKLIVTDSLFSMEGDLAPLVALANLADRHGAMLMVDDAHATGVFGGSGRGVAEHLGVAEGVHIKVGTLSKALGSAGGFVAGSRSLIEWLSNRARSYVFSTAPPAALAAAAFESLRLVREQPGRRTVLLDRAAKLRMRLQQLGWRTGPSRSQIIPLHVGDPRVAMQYAEGLRERGVLVPGIRPPTVPQGQSMLRLSLSYAHSPEMIERLVESLRELR